MLASSGAAEDPLMASGFELFPWLKNFLINPVTDWQRFINPQLAPELLAPRPCARLRRPGRRSLIFA
jgi:hypothetical protein